METIEEYDKKAAQKEYHKQYYKENLEAIKENQRNYRKRNLEAIKLGQKKYSEDNAEHIREQRRSYRESNKETIKDYKKRYREKNSEKIKDKKKKYYRENSVKILQHNKKYKTDRLKNDPIYKMVQILRTRMYQTLKSLGTKKSSKTLDLLGATKEEVWKHLESQFKDGMTRENHGLRGWHIDHIKPMCSFDLSDSEQLKECCHYTNLQPLWWWENLSKSDKILFDNSNK